MGNQFFRVPMVGQAKSSNHAHSSLDASDGNPKNAVVVDSNGNVGIGIDKPVYKLDAWGGARFSSSSSGSTYLKLQNSNSTSNWGIAAGGNGGWSNNNFVIDEDGVDQRFVIAPGGNIGIGPGTRAAKLTI
jgi:hypothetical protein